MREMKIKMATLKYPDERVADLSVVDDRRLTHQNIGLRKDKMKGNKCGKKSEFSFRDECPHCGYDGNAQNKPATLEEIIGKSGDSIELTDKLPDSLIDFILILYIHNFVMQRIVIIQLKSSF